MKRLVLMLVLMFAVAAEAKTTLRIPVQLDDGTTAAQLNAKLEKKGLESIPEYFEISTDKMDEVESLVDGMAVKIHQALNELEIDGADWQTQTIPNSDFGGTCYVGQGGQDVVDLAFALAGVYYSEQMTLWGWKFKKQMVLNEEMQDSQEIDGFVGKRSELWRDWRGDGEALLLVVAVSDDGDDVNDTLITKCR